MNQIDYRRADFMYLFVCAHIQLSTPFAIESKFHFRISTRKIETEINEHNLYELNFECGLVAAQFGIMSHWRNYFDRMEIKSNIVTSSNVMSWP